VICPSRTACGAPGATIANGGGVSYGSAVLKIRDRIRGDLSHDLPDPGIQIGRMQRETRGGTVTIGYEMCVHCEEVSTASEFCPACGKAKMKWCPGCGAWKPAWYSSAEVDAQHGAAC